jgi:Domain of unknown function (DUF4190)
MSQQNYPYPGDQQPEGWTTQYPAQPGAPYGYVPGGYPPQFYAPPRKTNNLALTAMIVSICSLVLFCGPVGIVGAIMGHKARGQCRRQDEDGDGMALAGIILGWISFGLFFVVIVGYGILIAIIAANGGFEPTTTTY